MIDTLVTYIAFHRLPDIDAYFLKNVEIVKPKRSIVYIDNVYDEFHNEIIRQVLASSVEVRTGNWRDKNLCVINILKDMRKDNSSVLIIDSDNLIDPGFNELDDAMEKNGHDFYTMLEHERKSMALDSKRITDLGIIALRDGRKIQVRNYKIAGTLRAIFYIGPKQGMRFGSRFLASLDGRLIDQVDNSVRKLHAGIGNQLSDESTLGLICYYSGVKTTPWVEFTRHVQHGAGTGSGENFSSVLKSIAHCDLARGVFSSKRPRVYWYYFRYKVTELARALIGN